MICDIDCFYYRARYRDRDRDRARDHGYDYNFDCDTNSPHTILLYSIPCQSQLILKTMYL